MKSITLTQNETEQWAVDAGFRLLVRADASEASEAHNYTTVEIRSHDGVVLAAVQAERPQWEER